MKIPLPTSADTAQIEAWITSRPLRDLVTAFGGAWPRGDTARVLDELDGFSRQVWDFRAGQERHLARRADFDGATTSLIMDSVEALGMVVPEQPKFETYTHLLVLGGLIRACAQRPEHAARLFREIDAGEVVALGSHRPLTDVEKELGVRLGLGHPETEVEAMAAGMAIAFDGTDQRHRTIAAPSGDPTRRANTADTYRFWAGGTPRGGRLLLVTSTAYVPFQHVDAVRVLGVEFGFEVDTVGLAPTALPFTAANYLQEVRSAVRSMRALWAVAAR